MKFAPNARSRSSSRIAVASSAGSPQPPPALQERDAVTAADDRASPPRILIHQDEGVPRSDDRRDRPQRPVDLVPPAIRPPSAQVRGNAGGLATTAQGVETTRLVPQAGAEALLERVA